MARLTGRLDDRIRTFAEHRLSPATRERFAPLYRRLTAWPPIGAVRFGSLKRLTPISRSYGFDRGKPIDRHYIEEFLHQHAAVDGEGRGPIAGRVLEVGEDRYAHRFASEGAIEKLDILDISATNFNATVVEDLADGGNIPSNAYECVICTQTLLLIYDVRAAVATLHRILSPGGTLFVTVPGISGICRPEMETWGDYWRFTTASLRRLLEEPFEPGGIDVEAYGNVMSATAFLYGLAAEDLDDDALLRRDPAYQVLIAAMAVKEAP